MAGWKDKRRVMQRYDLTADMYEERYAEEQQAKYEAALENVKLAGKRVLDVGCGTGLFFSHAAACASMVVGVDISRKLLHKSQRRGEEVRVTFLFCRRTLTICRLAKASLRRFSHLRCFRTCQSPRKPWGTQAGREARAGALS